MAKIFISGPMTGIENGNKEAFDECMLFLKNRGHSVFNPAGLTQSCIGNDWSAEDFQAIDFMALSRCDVICMLPGWEKSDGAVKELEAAEKNDNIEIIYYTPKGFLTNRKGQLWDVDIL